MGLHRRRVGRGAIVTPYVRVSCGNCHGTIESVRFATESGKIIAHGFCETCGAYNTAEVGVAST